MSASKKNEEIYSEIINILTNAKISVKNMKIAQMFFDFEKEADYSLLNKLKFSDFISAKQHIREVAGGMSRNFIGRYLLTGESDEYCDRYILFLDSLYSHTMPLMLTMKFVAESENPESNLSRIIVHSLSKVYSSDIVVGKIAAMIAGSASAYSFPERLLELAKQNVSSIYCAAYSCYDTKDIYTKIKLYAVALAYTDKIDDSIKHYIDSAISYIRSLADGEMDSVFNIVTASCFMAVKQESSMKELLIQKIQGKEDKFLSSVLVSVPNFYFKENANNLIDILSSANPTLKTKDYIKYITNFKNRSVLNYGKNFDDNFECFCCFK